MSEERETCQDTIARYYAEGGEGAGQLGAPTIMRAGTAMVPMSVVRLVMNRRFELVNKRVPSTTLSAAISYAKKWTEGEDPIPFLVFLPQSASAPGMWVAIFPGQTVDVQLGDVRFDAQSNKGLKRFLELLGYQTKLFPAAGVPTYQQA